MTTLLDVVSATTILIGSFLALGAAVGLLRFPDMLTRMHAATKPQVLGLTLIVIGAAIQLRDNVDVWMLVLVVLFQMVTAPVAAHLVGRLAYRRQNFREDNLLVDELKDRLR